MSRGYQRPKPDPGWDGAPLSVAMKAHPAGVKVQWSWAVKNAIITGLLRGLRFSDTPVEDQAAPGRWAFEVWPPPSAPDHSTSRRVAILDADGIALWEMQVEGL